MNIAVGSAFRNSEANVTRYFKRIDALQEHAGPAHRVRVIAVEGDSTDGTRDELASYCRYFDVDVITCNHGCRVFGSTEEQERMDALTHVGNAILRGVRADDDVLLYVESDLLWEPHDVGTLIDMAVERRHGHDIYAPMVYSGPDGRGGRLFYDIYAFRKDGRRFSPFAPYHGGLDLKGVTGIDSAGSCLVMRAAVAREVRMPAGRVLVGFCEQAAVQGYSTACVATCAVRHP